ncbi:MAG: bifunctional phosphoribosyl-AMP cyclohydrolase/phosphoribosyl-ATP diphosphatase HisIE [Bacteroidota bacterium]
MTSNMIKDLNFKKGNGLIPCVIQDDATQKALMLGYMNAEALEKTQTEGRVTFFSRTKNRLWTKGETSGNFLHVKSIVMDCDRDALLVKVDPVGEVCHTGSDTCWNEKNEGDAFLFHLEKVIQERKNNPSEKSYTASLFQKGINKIAQKVGEEAVEIVIEAKDENDDLFLGEAADLMYHFLVLLAAKDKKLDDVIEVLKKRHS